MTNDQPIPILCNDEQQFQALAKCLTAHGFEVAAHQARLEDIAAAADGQVLVLDAQHLSDGLATMRSLPTPMRLSVVMLISKGDDIDRIVALEAGADDCLIHPVNPRELAARIRVLRRRGASLGADWNDAASSPRQLVVGDLTVDFSRRQVTLTGEALRLSSTEFRVLAALAEEAGRVVPYEKLHHKVYSTQRPRVDHALKAHITHIREKITSLTGQRDRIKTIHGVGYLFASTT